MKKLLSIALAVVMMCTLAFSAAAADHSILPESASDFTANNTNNGTISVSKDGDSFVFEGTTEWPAAFYVDESNWLYFNTEDDLYLYYDFEVVSGATNVIVYFAGQDPMTMANMGTFVCINGLVDPSYVGPTGDAVTDLPVGKYVGKVGINDMGYGVEYMDDEGNMMVSGCKVFAVGDNSKVIVNELTIGGPRGGEEEEETTTTTTKGEDTKATTTTKKAANKDDSTDSAKTGDVSNAVLFVVVAVAAAGVVTLSAVSKKAKSR